MQFETVDYRICTYYLPALFNGDMSGLDDGEEKRLEAFEARVRENAPPGCVFAHWAGTDDGEELAQCEVSTAPCLSTVERIQAVYRRESN